MYIYTFEGTRTSVFLGKPKRKIMFLNAITSVTHIRAGYIVAESKSLHVQAEMTVNILLISCI